MNSRSQGLVLGLALGVCSLAACGGDLTSQTGKNNLLVYSLYTIYEVPEHGLSDARILTGHQQLISVSMTAEGRRNIVHPGAITHRLEPSAGVTMDNGDHVSENTVRDARFTVTEPGDYTLVSSDGDEIVDEIDLHFETPAGFEVVMKIRDPWGASFSVETGDPLEVEQGSQLVILPVPVDEDARRLAGSMQPGIDIDPRWAVTPGQNVYSNTEDVTWSGQDPYNYYFIEPVTVTFTISDDVTGANSTQTFHVVPVDTDG